MRYCPMLKLLPLAIGLGALIAPHFAPAMTDAQALTITGAVLCALMVYGTVTSIFVELNK